jgi:hypothetical protein
MMRLQEEDEQRQRDLYWATFAKIREQNSNWRYKYDANHKGAKALAWWSNNE